MDNARLAQLLFGDLTLTEEDIAKRYPQRELPEGAKVTRFGPSPTGFVHFGGLEREFLRGGLQYRHAGGDQRGEEVESATDLRCAFHRDCLRSRA